MAHVERFFNELYWKRIINEASYILKAFPFFSFLKYKN